MGSGRTAARFIMKYPTGNHTRSTADAGVTRPRQQTAAAAPPCPWRPVEGTRGEGKDNGAPTYPKRGMRRGPVHRETSKMETGGAKVTALTGRPPRRGHSRAGARAFLLTGGLHNFDR